MCTGLQQLRLDKQLATSERPEPAVRQHVSWSRKRRKLAAGSMCAALRSGVPPGTDFFLEQPRNSQLQLHPCFQMLISHLASHETTLLRNSLSLGEFGGESEKTLWLYSIQPLDLDTPTDLPPSSSGSSDALVTIQYPSWI